MRQRRYYQIAIGALIIGGLLAWLKPLPAQAGACECWERDGPAGTDCYYNLDSPISCQMIKNDTAGLKVLLRTNRDVRYKYCDYTDDEGACGWSTKRGRQSVRYKIKDTAQYLGQTITCGTAPKHTPQTCTNIDEECDSDQDCLAFGGGDELGPSACYLGYCFLGTRRYEKFKEQPGLFGYKADLRIQKPLFEIRIPGLNFSDVQANIDAEGNIQIPYLAEFLTVAYRLAMVVASIVAAVMLIINGFRVVASGGGEQKGAAYKRIAQVVIGLFILWGSYAILYNLNPALVSFKALRVRYILAQDLPEESDSIPEDQYPTLPDVKQPTWKHDTFKCEDVPPPAGVMPESKVIAYRCPGIDGEIKTIPQMKDPLCKAARLALDAGYKFSISPGGSYRPYKDQVDGWCKKGKAKYPDPDTKTRKKFFATPGYSNHGHGRAVDITLEKGNERVFNIDSKEQCGVNPKDIERLAKFFYDADPNFVRLETEIWHFEYGTAGQKARSRTTAKASTCK